MKKNCNSNTPDSEEWKLVLREGASYINVFLTDDQIESFSLFLKELLEWNKQFNITGIKCIKGIIIKSFIDSLSIVEYIPHIGQLVDLGSGGGFPGIPIKIVKPSLFVILVEASRKKANFLRQVIRILNLQNIVVYQTRAEALPSTQVYDCVISRAFSGLKYFLQIGSALIKDEGLLIAMKGKKAENELKQVTETMEKTNMVLIEKKLLSLPYGGGERSILVFKKMFHVKHPHRFCFAISVFYGIFLLTMTIFNRLF